MTLYKKGKWVQLHLNYMQSNHIKLITKMFCRDLGTDLYLLFLQASLQEQVLIYNDD